MTRVDKCGGRKELKKRDNGEENLERRMDGRKEQRTESEGGKGAMEDER